MTTHHDFTLNRPGALIAAVPAVLGFVPQNSLVIVGIERGQMGAVMRLDLEDAFDGAVDGLADVASTSGADAAIAVIVAEDRAGHPSFDSDCEGLCAHIAAVFEGFDITLIDAHVVDRIAAGGRWRCADGCGLEGSVDDPAASPLSAAAVLDGRRLYGSRRELEAVITPDSDGDVGALAQAIDELGAAAPDPPEHARRREAVAFVLECVRRVEAGEKPTDAETARLAHGFTDVIVRDAVYALALGPLADAAEQLWLHLARTLPAPWRAEALTFVGFFAYARGDGPLAGVALEAALDVDPAHRMARLLDNALQSGMRPQRIRELAHTGSDLAEALGVPVPGVRPSRPSRRAPSRGAGRRSRGRGR
jgi:hypothetical protein